MKITLSSNRNRYAVRICVFLAAIALIAGTVGCDDESCVLAISSTEGGSVIAPGEGTFAYSATTVVNLVAQSEEGYYFVGWTGDVETIASAGAAFDVFEKEPITDSPLFTEEKIIVTPHLGASTIEAQASIARDVADEVLAVLQGRFSKYAVNAPHI